jgi:tetratricopeptide (TPR) repeat protein
VAAIERAIAIDSASEPVERQNCQLCEDLSVLANIYLWADSLPAADRTARRYLRLRPRSHNPWHVFVVSSALRGDSAAMRSHLRRLHETNPHWTSPLYEPRYQVLAEEYDAAGRALQPLADSPRETEAGEARWLWSIALRNQGRLNEAFRLARATSHPNVPAEAMIQLERGNARAAVSIFDTESRRDQSGFPPAREARQHAWQHTLLGMALAAAGDTGRLHRLADTVEYWGRRSSYGRDRRAHHYLRGMLLIAQGRDAEAGEQLRLAIASPTHGFTRVNYELGRTLIRLGRPAEAVPIVRAALHGGIDGPNLYITRTDLHELLARAFDLAGNPDSAVVHHRAVVRAWVNADPLYHARRDSALARLSR